MQSCRSTFSPHHSSSSPLRIFVDVTIGQTDAGNRIEIASSGMNVFIIMFRLQASAMGLFYIRVNVKAQVTGSITKWSPNATARDELTVTVTVMV